MDTAITQNFFQEEEMSAKFTSFVRLVHTLALNGELEEGATIFKFLVLLTGKIDSKYMKTHDYLIDVIWTLVYRDTKIVED